MVLVYLLSFFRELLSCSDKNKLTPEKISEILCECLIGEDKLTTSKSAFKGENLVRDELFTRRLMSQVGGSPGKARPSTKRQSKILEG